MPLYEYGCNTCGAVFDAMRMVEDRDRPIACACGFNATRRMTVPQRPTGSATDFSDENGGRGRFIPQLAQVTKDASGARVYSQADPGAFAKSQSHALELARNRGLDARTS